MGNSTFQARLVNVHFNNDKVLAYIRPLNVNKAHGWDNISIRMIRICDDSLVKPLIHIFRCSFVIINGRLC